MEILNDDFENEPKTDPNGINKDPNKINQNFWEEPQKFINSSSHVNNPCSKIGPPCVSKEINDVVFPGNEYSCIELEEEIENH